MRYCLLSAAKLALQIFKKRQTIQNLFDVTDPTLYSLLQSQKFHRRKRTGDAPNRMLDGHFYSKADEGTALRLELGVPGDSVAPVDKTNQSDDVPSEVGQEN
jgi:hypothetical protein